MNLEHKLKHYRINSNEHKKILELLGREPEGVEWALFSALWSEHCSYKSSKVHLKKFYNKNEKVLEAFGENAGVIDLGEGERIAFKMESHNHPSFIEPYQGAATGVGGILRDIFTMGARPIALANYLCFGHPKAPRMNTLVEGVVAGISGYGNCVGVPNVTGQTEFDEAYNGNILVNAFALGLFEKGEKIFTSKASGIGNYVVYVGAKTGKDGVHGASMASESFDEDSESKRPNIQVGDPFFEKLLIESCLEVMNENLVVAIQDMGAAGLTSSSFEMASKGGVGLQINLDKVPLRDPTMTPEEILLSESQERMLLVCEPNKLSRIQSIFKKWDLDAEVIGEVKKERTVQLNWRGKLLTEIDPDLLVENAPMYQREYTPWVKKDRTAQLKIQDIPSVMEVLMKILGDVRAGSREWIFKQYDQRVGGRTSMDCSQSIGVLHLPQTKRALGIALGNRPYLTTWDAHVGGKDAVILPSLELSAKGIKPLAVTDCLNFGNPEKPEVMTQFVAAVESMSEACEKLDAPVISGNVSFYNETQGVNIHPTPATGVVGLRSKIEQMPKSHFVSSGSQIFLLRSPQMKIVTSQIIKGDNPLQGVGSIESERSANFCQFVREIVELKGVEATRVCTRFGLAYNLVRLCQGNLGFSVQNGSFLETDLNSELDLVEKEWNTSGWFIENFYDVLIVVKKEQADEFAKVWSKMENSNIQKSTFNVLYKTQPLTQLWRIGEVVSDRVIFEGEKEQPLNVVLETYNKSWGNHFEILA